jgi:hypothetical protein
MVTKTFQVKMGIVLIASLLLAGCQAGNVQPAATQETAGGLGVPYTRGPSSPPNVKGPSAPFPSAALSQQNQPQMATENVNKKFSLN